MIKQFDEEDKKTIKENTTRDREELPLIKYGKEPSRWTGMDITSFMKWAVEVNTSDVTIQTDEQIMCEIHGRFYRVTNRRLSHSELVELVAKIYESDSAISKLNGGEDVDLAWSIRIGRESALRFRVNITAILTNGVTGYQITIRTINSRAPLLESMNVPQPIIDNMTHKQGMIIVVGATGSGKSTFLASVVDWRIRQPNAHIKILTYEAPIEYVYDDVDKPTASIAQTEIGKHLPSFAAGVRNALRRKPSVIIMGEMRDKETIGEGIIASSTGHLVYGTLHSNGVAESIRRMINVFEPGERNGMAMDILSNIKMVVAQMLLPTLDGKRVAIREYLVFNEEILTKLLEAPLDNITYETRRVLMKHGQTFLQDAQAKFDEGLIASSELEKIRQLTKGALKDVLESSSNVDVSEIMEDGIELKEEEIENIKKQKALEEFRAKESLKKKKKDDGQEN